MLDLTSKKPLKVGFKYEHDGQVKEFTYEGVVNYRTVGVYQKHLKNLSDNKAIVRKDQSIELNLAKQLKQQADAEYAMMEEFFQDKYGDFKEALEECGVDQSIVINHVVEQILTHMDEIQKSQKNDKGKK